MSKARRHKKHTTAKHSDIKRNRRFVDHYTRLDDHRDRLVTALYGDVGHGTCGRKKAYSSYQRAKKAIARIGDDATDELFAYKCSRCGCWHLTSHPRIMVSGAGSKAVTIVEAFSAAREAAIEIRKLELEASERIDACGIGARSYEAHGSPGSILDPMRKVDELVDWQAERIDAAELNRPIEEAARIVAGIDAMGDTLAVEIVTRYYLQAEPWKKIAADVANRYDALAGMEINEASETLRRTLAVLIASWDEIGIAKLKQMGEE